MAKTIVIQYKYPDKPWIEWARTTVPEIVDHYEHGAQIEHPGAEVRRISLLK